MALRSTRVAADMVLKLAATAALLAVALLLMFAACRHERALGCEPR